MTRALCCVLLAGTSGAAYAQQQDPWAAADVKARSIIDRLTVDEKVEQLLNVAPAIPRLGIPAYNWWTESLHGVIGVVPTTNFPEPIGLAATFDAPLIQDVASAISTEVQALHTLGRQTGHLGRIGTGLDTWSPNINIFRDPRWGRGQETYGEDPFLTSRIGVAFIRGMKGDDPALPDVVATPKHFAVHSGPEPSRHTDNIFVTKHDLEDPYLPAFRAAIVDAQAGSIMCAYNRVDGQPACGSQMLLQDHLRGAWGFKGYVVSDCDAVIDIYDHHKYAPDPATGISVALRYGVDNECNNGTVAGKTGLSQRYKDALAHGYISTRDIDTALVRLFSARYRNGDLAGFSSRRPNATPVKAIGTPEHNALALATAEKSLVLLKNDDILPLKPGSRIVVAGPLADATRVLRGNYSSPRSGTPMVVAMNGSAVDLSWAKENAAAILEAWYPGQAGGLAIGNVLAGKTNPSGRLPLTFYKTVADLPPFNDYGMKGRTYRYFTGAPVYPFGHGLSYTSFNYAPLAVDPVDGSVANGLRICTSVTNAGKRTGDEVAQVYLTPPGFDGAPRTALRGFQRVSLNPGETKAIEFTLSARDLSFVTKDGERALIPGNYQVSIGSGQPGDTAQKQSRSYAVQSMVPLPK